MAVSVGHRYRKREARTLALARLHGDFATVRLRERVTKGAGSRTKGLLMAFKLLDMAQQRWRRLDGVALLPLVRAGVKFVDGVQKQARATTQSTEAAPRAAA